MDGQIDDRLPGVNADCRLSARAAPAKVKRARASSVICRLSELLAIFGTRRIERVLAANRYDERLTIEDAESKLWR